MEAILDEIRATYDCGIWFPVVSSVLMLPDACGAVEFWGTGKRTSERYIEWYDKWVLPHFVSPDVKFDGSVLYIVRNAIIHEYTGFTRGKHGFDRIMFMPPNKYGISLNFFLSSNNGQMDEVAFQVTIHALMEAMDLGVRNWLSEIRLDTDSRRKDAADKLLQLRPNGQSPHFTGLPLVC